MTEMIYKLIKTYYDLEKKKIQNMVWLIEIYAGAHPIAIDSFEIHAIKILLI